MEEEGLIKRVPCKEDKRVVRMHLTAKGKQMRDVSRNTVIKFNEAVQSRFTPTQLNNFRTGDDRTGSDTRTRTTLLKTYREDGAKETQSEMPTE